MLSYSCHNVVKCGCMPFWHDTPSHLPVGPTSFGRCSRLWGAGSQEAGTAPCGLLARMKSSSLLALRRCREFGGRSARAAEGSVRAVGAGRPACCVAGAEPSEFSSLSLHTGDALVVGSCRRLASRSWTLPPQVSCDGFGTEILKTMRTVLHELRRSTVHVALLPESHRPRDVSPRRPGQPSSARGSSRLSAAAAAPRASRPACRALVLDILNFAHITLK